VCLLWLNEKNKRKSGGIGDARARETSFSLFHVFDAKKRNPGVVFTPSLHHPLFTPSSARFNDLLLFSSLFVEICFVCFFFFLMLTLPSFLFYSSTVLSLPLTANL
jgi:hypothetical protein